MIAIVSKDNFHNLFIMDLLFIMCANKLLLICNAI